jgi:hypothetical protein
MSEEHDKLFIVDFSCQVVVMAKDWCSAQNEASYLEMSDILEDSEFEAWEATELKDLPKGWTESIPFNSQDDRKCGDVLKELIEKREKKEKFEKADKLQNKFPFYTM